MKPIKRKIIKQGLGGYTLYLPKNWINDRGLDIGDEIYISVLDDGNLLIKSSRIEKEKKIVIKVEENYLSLFMDELMALYESGYNEIKIIFSSPKLRNIEENKDENIIEVVEKAISRMIGFEIVKIKKDRITIRDIATTQPDEFDTIFRRVFYLLFLFGDMLKKKPEMVEYNSQYRAITKFISFCLRTLSFTDKHEQEKIQYVGILHILDKIADSYLFLAKYYPKTMRPYEKEILLKTLEMIHLFSDTFYQTKNKNKLIEEYYAIKKDLNNPKRNLNDTLVQFSQVNEYVQAMIKPMIALHKIKEKWQV